MNSCATEDARYPDGVTLKEVWEAMRAAAETENYKIAHQIAVERAVAWMCPVCVERHVKHDLTIPLTLKPEEVFSVQAVHDAILISIDSSEEHYALPICKICYDAWQMAFVNKHYPTFQFPLKASK